MFDFDELEQTEAKVFKPLVLCDDAQDVVEHAAGKSIEDVIWQSSAEVVRAIVLFGPGIVALPFLGKVCGVDVADSLTYKSHPRRGDGGLLEPIDFEARYGLLDPQQVMQELSGDLDKLCKRLETMTDNALRKEVVLLQDWSRKAGGRIKLLEKRVASELLGIPVASADVSEVNRAFKRKALELHPDKGGDEEQFKLLKDMKDVLIGLASDETHIDENRSHERKEEFERSKYEEMRLSFHRSLTELAERVDRLTHELRDAEVKAANTNPVEKLQRFLDNFMKVEVGEFALSTPESADTLFCRLLEAGSEVICAAGFENPESTVMRVTMTFTHPITSAVTSETLRQRCAALVQAIEALPSISDRISTLDHSVSSPWWHGLRPAAYSGDGEPDQESQSSAEAHRDATQVRESNVHEDVKEDGNATQPNTREKEDRGAAASAAESMPHAVRDVKRDNEPFGKDAKSMTKKQDHEVLSTSAAEPELGLERNQKREDGMDGAPRAEVPFEQTPASAAAKKKNPAAQPKSKEVLTSARIPDSEVHSKSSKEHAVGHRRLKEEKHTDPSTCSVAVGRKAEADLLELVKGASKKQLNAHSPETSLQTSTEFVVVHRQVLVRSRPSTDSKRLGILWYGDMVSGSPRKIAGDRWLLLDATTRVRWKIGGNSDAWVLVHGQQLGLGALLQEASLLFVEASDVRVLASSGRSVKAFEQILGIGSRCHYDRRYAFTDLGYFGNCPDMRYILTSNEDKDTPTNSLMWTIHMLAHGTVYLNFRSEGHVTKTGASAWLRQGGWVRSNLKSTISTGYPNGPYSGPVFSKSVVKGATVKLMGSNSPEGTYFVFVQMQKQS